MNKQRVAAYCRVSTTLEIQEDSLKTQQEWFQNKYKDNPNAELVGIYVDHTSGTSIGKRPGFCSMLADCRAGKIDVIVTKSISRFSRNMADFLQVIREVKQLGIAVDFEREGINTMNAQGEMILSVLAAISQEEINTISRSLTWAIRRRDASGNPNYRVSFGYRRDAGSGNWLIHEVEAMYVREAFRMAFCGKTYAEISARLVEMEKTKPTGAKWTQRRLHYVLTNEHYIGDILTQKTCMPDYLNHRRVRNRGIVDQYYLQDHHIPIIDRQTFRQVQTCISEGLLHSRRRSA